MEKMNKDTLFLLGVEMELPALLNFCTSSKDINNKVCKNNNFWLYKLKKEFPDEKFLSGKSPRERYILLYSLRDIKEKLGEKNSLQEIYDLKKLDLSDRSIKELPVSIGNLSNLQELYLYNNYLRKIPVSIGNLSNLRILNLSNNSLKELPTSIGNLLNLEKLNLYKNSLKRLPYSIGNLSKLKILDLYENSLEELPISMRNLSNLRELYLDDEKIIPSFLKNKRKLHIYLI